MNKPTHQDIEQRAYSLWQEQGCPDGRETELWLEAERQLSAPGSETTDQSGSSGGHPPSAVAAEQKVAQQKEAARAPMTPHTSPAPKAKPAPTGKPVWPKPHSA